MMLASRSRPPNFPEKPKAARHARDHADVVRAELGPGAVAARLLDGLVKLGVGHPVRLALDDGVGLLALVMRKTTKSARSLGVRSGTVISTPILAGS